MPRPKKANRSDNRYEIQRTVGHDPDGKRIVKSFYGKNKDEAVRKYQEYLAGIEKIREEKKRMPFELWAERWLRTYKEPDVKPTTYTTTYARPCKNYIIPYFKERFIQDITQVDIKQFLNSVSDRSQSLIDKIIICLHGIFEAAIDNDIVSKNPCRNVSAKSKAKKATRRTYDEASVDILCASEHKYALWVCILLKMGLRCSELCGLRWEDIDLDAGLLHVKQALTTEGGRIFIDVPKSVNSVRRLDIPEDLITRLRSARTKDPDAEYVAMLDGRHVTPNHFGDRQLEIFYNAMRVPPEQRLSPHELRHTCGTLLYQKTKDIYFVSRFLGHSDIVITTKTYVHSEMQESSVHIDFY